VFVIVQSATIHKRDSIPVTIIYQGRLAPGVRNLDEKVQVPHDIIQHQTRTAGILEDQRSGGIENLQEKVQVPSEQLSKNGLSSEQKKEESNVQFVPNKQESIESIDKLSLPKNEETLTETALKPDNDISRSEQEKFSNNLEQSEISEQLKETIPQENILENNPNTLLNEVRNVIYQGLNSIKTNVDNMASGLRKPSEEAWRDLNSTIEKLFENEYKDINLKQDNQNPTTAGPIQNQFVQNIISGFQNAASQFVQNFQQNQQVNGTEDEQQQGGPNWGQNVISSIQGGFQQVFTNIQNLGQQSSTSNTVLGDTGASSTTQSSNIIGTVISSFQQIFSGQNQGNPIQGIGISQSDTGVTTTTQRNPVQIFQQIGSQIGSAIFGQSSSKPPGSEDEGSATTQSTNFIQNIGQAFQNVNPFRPQGGQQGGGQQGGGQQGASQPDTGSNPIVAGAQVVGNQIQQGLQNAINQNPLSSSSSTEKSREGSTEAQKIESPVEEVKPQKTEQEDENTKTD